MAQMYTPARFHYEKQGIATLNQAAPTQNLYYDVLAETHYVRLIYVNIYQNNDDVAAKDIQARITMDGVVSTCLITALNGTAYYLHLAPTTDTTWSYNTGAYNAAWTTDPRGHTVQVELRITSVNGTNQTLTGHVQYETLEAGNTGAGPVGYSPTRLHYWKMPIATDTETPPTQGTYYTVLDEDHAIRVLYLTLYQQNDDLANKILWLRAYIDGLTLGPTAYTLANNTYTYLYLYPQGEYFFNSATLVNSGYYEGVRARNIMIEYLMNSVPGTNQTMSAYVQYEKLLPCRAVY